MEASLGSHLHRTPRPVGTPLVPVAGAWVAAVTAATGRPIDRHSVVHARIDTDLARLLAGATSRPRLSATCRPRPRR